MPSLSYPTNLDIPGPWILDTKNIEDLDRLVESCWESMRNKREALIDSAVSKWRERRLESGVTPEKVAAAETADRDELEKGYPLGTQTRKIVVYLSGGRSAEGQTFGEWRRSHWLTKKSREDLIYPWKWREAHSV